MVCCRNSQGKYVLYQSDIYLLTCFSRQMEDTLSVECNYPVTSLLFVSSNETVQDCGDNQVSVMVSYVCSYSAVTSLQGMSSAEEF